MGRLAVYEALPGDWKLVGHEPTQMLKEPQRLEHTDASDAAAGSRLESPNDDPRATSVWQEAWQVTVLISVLYIRGLLIYVLYPLLYITAIPVAHKMS